MIHFITNFSISQNQNLRSAGRAAAIIERAGKAIYYCCARASLTGNGAPVPNIEDT